MRAESVGMFHMSDEHEGSAEEDVDSSTASVPDSPSLSIDPSVLELDFVFSVLSQPRRRYLLYALAENPEWTLTELATKLVAWETGVEEEAVDAERRDQMYLSLYHTHVPKLVDEDVVTFDAETETLARGQHATQVLAALAGAGHSLDATQEQHASRAYDSPSEPGEEDP